jgi:asparagine synthase (glutamine-hydrolysing)
MFGSGVLVFNGEIYNHRELRAEISNASFVGHGDSETLLTLLDREGPRCISRLNGIFAFAYLDRQGKRLYLARDRFGVKPLYYFHKGDRLIFASELAPIIEAVGNVVELSNLALTLRHRSCPAPRTIYRDIYKVQPGTYLALDLGRGRLAATEHSYRLQGVSEASTGRHIALDRYGTTLADAVDRQLLSDVEVGVFLSGGVDSALISAIVARKLSYRAKAFTVGFTADDSADEVREAELTARALGLEHHSVIMSRDDFLDSLTNCAAIIEEPTATTSIVPMHYLARLAAQHVKVVLSGQGADETSGGYSRYRAEALFSEPLSHIARWSLSALPFVRGTRGARLLSYLAHRDESDRYLQAHEVFNSAVTSRLLGRTIVDERLKLSNYGQFRDPVNRMMGYDLAYDLPNDLLLYTDKITMRFSLECRVPFLDNELVSFLMSLPAKLKVGPLRGKILHRALARRFLGFQAAARPKRGFLVPTARWFRESKRHWDFLLSGGTFFDTLFDRREVERLLRRHADGANIEKQIMMLLTCRSILARSVQAAA